MIETERNNRSINKRFLCKFFLSFFFLSFFLFSFLFSLSPVLTYLVPPPSTCANPPSIQSISSYSSVFHPPVYPLLFRFLFFIPSESIETLFTSGFVYRCCCCCFCGCCCCCCCCCCFCCCSYCCCCCLVICFHSSYLFYPFPVLILHFF